MAHQPTRLPPIKPQSSIDAAGRRKYRVELAQDLMGAMCLFGSFYGLWCLAVWAI